MNEKTKESKFLDAINKYAEQQKAQITQEIEDYKNEKIEQATEQGLQDAYDLIREDIAARKAAIVNEFSREELKLKNSLYAERQSICDEVFHEAENKLKAFVKTDEYSAFLQRSLTNIAARIGDESCVVHLASFDVDRSDMICEKLPRANIYVDSHITIGGVKVSCPSKHIMLDDTLDTRLDDQRVWFFEHSGLKVMQ